MPIALDIILMGQSLFHFPDLISKSKILLVFSSKVHQVCVTFLNVGYVPSGLELEKSCK